MNCVNDCVGLVDHTQVAIDIDKSLNEESMQYFASSRSPLTWRRNQSKYIRPFIGVSQNQTPSLKIFSRMAQ